MKMKLNLSGDGIKKLALAHGEKAVFALGVLIFATFVYAFFGRVTLSADKAPDKLEAQAKEAVAHMDRQQWDEKRENLSIADYVQRARQEALLPSDYALPMPLDLPPWDSKHKRPEPALLAIESLQSSGGFGAFELKDPKEREAEASRMDAHPRDRDRHSASRGAASGPRGQNITRGADAGSALHGQRWVMVTGLVPVKKQVAAYEEAFKDTIPVAESFGGDTRKDADKQRDMPAYVNVHIERAEVVDGKEKNLQWKPVEMLAVVKMMQTWADSTPDIVSRDFVDHRYTMPLGPLRSAEWDEKAAHPPEIPLATEYERKNQEKLAAEENKRREEGLEKEAESGGFGGGDANDDRRGGRPGGRNLGPRMGLGDDRREQKAVDYRLFRFTDYMVEPNKRYCYRARLSVENPNHELADKYLKNIQTKVAKTLDTPWSEPSPIVGIPSSEGMLVGEPKPRPVTSSEQTASMRLYTLEPTTGLPAATDLTVARGSVLNVTAQVDLYSPTDKKVEEKAVAFNTNALVLDIRGGSAMRSSGGREKLLEPSEVLLFDGAGRLVAHSELDEVELFEEHAAGAPQDGVPTMQPLSAGLVAPVASDKKTNPKGSKNTKSTKRSKNPLDLPVATPAAGKSKKKSRAP